MGSAFRMCVFRVAQLCHRVWLALYFAMCAPPVTFRRKWLFSAQTARQILCQQMNTTAEQNGDA